MITVPSQLTLDSANAALEQLNDKADVGLLLPSTISCRSILSSASYIQFLLTWARLSASREVTVTVRSEKEIPFLGRSGETIIPILLASRVYIKNLETGVTNDVDLSAIRKQGLDLFCQLQGGLPVQQDLFGTDEFDSNSIPRKGSRVHLLAADVAKNYGFPNWFYRGPKEARKMRAPDDFPSLVRAVMTLVRGHSIKKFGQWADGLAEDLGAILYELVDNTHKWGRQGLTEEPVATLRGAIFDTRFDFPGNLTRLADIAEEIPIVSNFISFHQAQPKTRNLGLFELSVFDGGIGLAKRELARRGKFAPTIDEEYQATIECLRKWGSTSGQRGRGLGLDKVLDLTSGRQGLVYLRTGSLLLYRDFANSPSTGSATHGDRLERHQLFDGVTGTGVLTRVCHVEGTLLSVILPFDAAQQL